VSDPELTESILQSKVPQKYSGTRLVDYLAIRFPYQTRENWEKKILAGEVKVNEAPAVPDKVLSHGERVAYTVILREPPVDRNIFLIHEEESFLVAHKPGQLPSHGDGNFIKNTFVFLLNEMMAAKGNTRPLRLVHRLDRETSGLMVVARNKLAHTNLMRQFEEGSVQKEYLAIVQGKLEQDRFEVSGELGRDPHSSVTIRHALIEGGSENSRHSLTLFEKVQELPSATLVRCIPKTGRTNQIRVHLAHIGHPVVGDKLYGKTDAEFLEFINHVKAGGDPAFEGHAETSRQLLHAGMLTFDHPESGERVSFTDPMPEDMLKYMEEQAGGTKKP
jgi:23S rRNA pseudouridine1911/1915/1917 synthase